MHQPCIPPVLLLLGTQLGTQLGGRARTRV
jgi:hypothetical protein